MESSTEDYFIQNFAQSCRQASGPMAMEYESKKHISIFQYFYQSRRRIDFGKQLIAWKVDSELFHT